MPTSRPTDDRIFVYTPAGRRARNPSRKTGIAGLTRSILRYANDRQGCRSELQRPCWVSALSVLRRDEDIDERTSSITQKLGRLCRLAAGPRSSAQSPPRRRRRVARTQENSSRRTPLSPVSIVKRRSVIRYDRLVGENFVARSKTDEQPT